MSAVWNPVEMTGEEEEEEGPGERKETEETHTESVSPTALKRFEVFDHIPKQQVHIIPTMGHRFSELLLSSHPRLPFFISGKT